MNALSLRGFIVGAALASVLTLGSVAISDDNTGDGMGMMASMQQMMQSCMAMMEAEH
ncbi:hypothetical protein [Alloalcanivorax xenomutans]|jgi:hypothetical protein|uniref:hypothetical protein n=1 Tax=Alloalcanivorax xenomutans TaxID=1094342 RepID=UPI0004B26E11